MQLFEMQIDGFIEQLKILKRSPDTIRSYRYSLKTFIAFLEEEEIYDLKEIDHEAIRRYQEKLMEKKGNPYSLETIHLFLRGMKRFFEYLVKTNQILCDPTEKLVMPKLGTRLPKNIFTKKEVKKILSKPDATSPIGVRDKALLELLYSTGLRAGECARLSIYDVDYRGGYVRVRSGKGKKDRIQPLGKIACRWLKEYITQVRPKLLERDGSTGEERFFVSRSGHPIPVNYPSKVVKKYVRTAKVKGEAGAHSLRRAFATHMLREGAHPLYIQRLLGHSTGLMLDRYIRVLAKDLKKEHKRTHPREKDRR